jgi:hypothetical protein
MPTSSPRSLDPEDGLVPRPGASQRYAACIKQGSARTVKILFSLIVIASVLATTTVACAPIPCPAGYGDPNWCGHGGGGDGSGG